MIVPRRLSELLRDPIYLRIWLVGVSSGIARWLELLVVGVFAVEVTGSPVLVALLVILRMLPLVLFGSVVGTFADRVAPRFLLRLALFVAMLASGTVLALALSGIAAYWHVALATFASGMVWTTDMPVRRRLIGDWAGPKRIAAAMSLDSATSNATRMMGPLFGGLLYQWLGLGGAFGLAAALYFLSLVLTVGLPAAVLAADLTRRTTKLLGDLREGFRHLARERELRHILLVTVIFNIWGFPFVSMIPVVGKEELSLSASAIGGLAALEGGGAFAGALLVVVLGASPAYFRRLYFFGTTGYIAFAFVAGWMTDAVPMAVVIAFVGLCAAGFSTMQSTLIYSVAPPEMRGRLFGLLSISIGTGVIGFTNIGIMGELFGGSTAIRIVAAEGLIAALILGIRWQRLWRGAEGL
jgi:MFS family permease